MIFEGCEESGSRDLPHYMDKLAARIGEPDLICCLDAGCGNYEQLWVTTSLRGSIAMKLKVQVMTEGAHSGHSSGIVPSSFRISRELLSRIEDEKTGLIVPPEFYVEVPSSRLQQVKVTGGILGDTLVRQFPFVEGAHPVAKDVPISEHVLARTWHPALSITGCDGLPPTNIAGNVSALARARPLSRAPATNARAHAPCLWQVMLPSTTLKMSLRLPPTLDATQAAESLERILTSDPPQGAHVTLEKVAVGNGWHAPIEAPWLVEAAHTASLTYFDKPCAHMGEGGSIPFMAMLLDTFPKAQFLVTGAAGPGSNMHAPNEFLHIDYSARITMCVAQVVATLATKKAGEASSDGAAAAHASPAEPKSFVTSFERVGGNGTFFVGCDCGKTGCVIFDQGKEMGICRPVKAAKVAA